MAFLAYIPKLKSDQGLAFGTHFMHIFPLKCSLFNTLSMNKGSMSPFSFSRYRKNMLLSSYLDN